MTGILGKKKPFCKRGHPNPPRNAAGACIQCVSEYRKERYVENRARIIARSIAYHAADPVRRRDHSRATRHKVPVAEIRAVIERSGGKCEACGVAVEHDAMCIDHNHTTGVLRGVLCRFCNTLEGMLTKAPERVLQVRAYLARFDPVATADLARWLAREPYLEHEIALRTKAGAR